MNRGQRKNINRVNAAALARWIVITSFLALAGLCYVYLTLQLHRLGDQKKALETELVSLRQQNDVANVQIAALTSRNALQRRLKEGYLKMVPIAEQNIVRLAQVRPVPDENAIRLAAGRVRPIGGQVANDRIGK
jgi:cell division protein FtsB